jgi:hypothetical protein
VRAVGVIVPFLLAFASGLVVSQLLPPPDGFEQRLLWWVLATAAAIGVLRLAERGARRLLPLSTLLSMTLMFPDHAPSRLRVALQASLKQRLRAVETGHDTAQDHAEHLVTMVAALSRHDRRTVGHSERTRAYAALLADEVGLDADQSSKLQWAALLHDIGKLDVPAAILNKPGALNDEEREVIFGHPSAGEERAAPLIAWLGPWANGIWEHHEKVDGTGYPLGLHGDEISYSGRLVAVCDSFEVMTAARSYKKPVSLAAARAELVRCSGTHFDPQIVRAFLNISLGEVRVVAGPFAALAQLPYVAGWLSGTAGSIAAVAAVAGTVAVVVPASGTPPTQHVTTKTVAVASVPLSPTTSDVTITVGSTRATATTSPTLVTITVQSPPTVTVTATRSATTRPSATTAPPMTTVPPATTAPSATTTTLPPATTTTTTTTPAPTQIFVSSFHDRSSPEPANGSSFNVGADVYVFAVAPSASYVTFSIDGVVVRTDSAAPFDMVGSNNSGTYANKYRLPDSPGSFTVTVETFFAQGPSQVTTATISFH